MRIQCRAESLLGSIDDHPRSPELRTKLQSLKAQLRSGDTNLIEDMTYDLRQSGNEIETGAM